MQYNFSNFKTGLKKIEEFLGKEYSQLNIGRASPMVLDGVMVESYGSRVPLKNVASVSIEDPKTLRIAPWDKSQVKEIEKAIIASNLGYLSSTHHRNETNIGEGFKRKTRRIQDYRTTREASGAGRNRSARKSGKIDGGRKV